MKNIKNVNAIDRKIWLKAIDYALNGKLKHALIIYNKLLIKYINNGDLNYEASLLYIKEGNYFEAYSCMEKIFEEFQRCGFFIDCFEFDPCLTSRCCRFIMRNQETGRRSKRLIKNTIKGEAN